MRTYQQMNDEAMAIRHKLINAGCDPREEWFDVTATELKLMGKVEFGKVDQSTEYFQRFCGLKLRVK